MEQEWITIAGTIEAVIFRNEENGYAVLRLATESGDSFVVVGCMPNVGVGEFLIGRGVWGAHPSYGEQFQLKSCERHLPAAEGAILDYLSSGTVRGIGRKTAEKIVETFGTDTFRIIECEPERLAKISGITKERAKTMSDDFRIQNGISRLMEFLVSHGLEPQLALTLYRAYGSHALRLLQKNPYLLIDPMFGVDFSLADQLAFSLGMSSESNERIEAAVLYELTFNSDAGHCFIPYSKLCAVTAELIGAPLSQVESAVSALLEDNSLVLESICGEDACYLTYLYEAEVAVAMHLRSMLDAWHDGTFDPTDLIERIEAAERISYAPLQREALRVAANAPLFILTGGPGTGKTTVIRGILSLYERMGLSCFLAAPTGRAAKRMSEFCGIEAKTIHRMLEMGYSDQGSAFPIFGRDHDTPLECDVLILDEVSMVDLPLMRALLDALKPDTRLILVGDADQLPSVGPGNILKDLIDSGEIQTVALTEIFRQARESNIVVGAHEINQGELPDLTLKTGDLFFLPRREYSSLIETIVELCTTRLPENMGIPSNQIQVLTTNRKYETGTLILNRKLQEALNPPAPDKAEKRIGDKLFRVGDRVMQIRNNYDIVWLHTSNAEHGTGVFNGDVGEILKIDLSAEMMTIRFDDRVANYPFTQFHELELAYAMTVHKAQGSEFRAVIFASLGGSPYLLHRSVLYTAVTRARELLILVGERATLQRMVQNNRQRRRYSALHARLSENLFGGTRS